MKKKSGLTLKTIICVGILVALVVGYYYYTSNRSKNSDTAASAVELQTLLDKDIEESYPTTPSEVVNLYSRITKVLYEKELENSKVEKLGQQIRFLYDEELLASNPYDKYLLNLKSEIVEFKDEKRTVTKYDITDSKNIKYWEENEKNYASLIVTFTIKEKNEQTELNEKFLLRQDENGTWRILGWEITNSTD